MEYTNDPAVQFKQQPVEVAVEPVHEPVQYTQQVGAEPDDDRRSSFEKLQC